MKRHRAANCTAALALGPFDANLQSHIVSQQLKGVQTGGTTLDSYFDRSQVMFIPGPMGMLA